MATIVTHQSPDLDACMSVWLIKRYIKGFSTAEVMFVSAGHTLNDEPADKYPNIIHVDTGFGKFDHHQLSSRSSAALRIFEGDLEKRRMSEVEKMAISRIVEVVTMIDNFEECLLPDADSDFYDLGLHQIIRGYRIAHQNDHDVMQWALGALDGYYYIVANKVRAELDIAHGIPFEVGSVHCLGLLSGNEEGVVVAAKQGYELVVRKDPEAGIARIKVRPDSKISLKKLAEYISQNDKNAYWFLHASERMLLNGSRKYNSNKPTRYSLQELITIIKEHLL